MQQDQPMSGRLAARRTAERKTITLLAAFTLIAATLGFAGTYALLSQRTPAPNGPTKQQTKALADAQASFDANMKHLDSIHKYILSEYQEKSAYPVSATIQPASVAFAKKFEDNGPGRRGSAYYWSETGKDYKLVMAYSGDCFIARERRPETIDPARSWGTDCASYGYWTAGALTK
jgi:hypothetical protein